MLDAPAPALCNTLAAWRDAAAHIALCTCGAQQALALSVQDAFDRSVVLEQVAVDRTCVAEIILLVSPFQFPNQHMPRCVPPVKTQATKPAWSWHRVACSTRTGLDAIKTLLLDPLRAQNCRPELAARAVSTLPPPSSVRLSSRHCMLQMRPSSAGSVHSNLRTAIALLVDCVAQVRVHDVPAPPSPPRANLSGGADQGQRQKLVAG
jgi:hypothetical protein